MHLADGDWVEAFQRIGLRRSEAHHGHGGGGLDSLGRRHEAGPFAKRRRGHDRIGQLQEVLLPTICACGSPGLGLHTAKDCGRVNRMKTASVILEGDHLTVRLPKGVHLPTPTVSVRPEGESVVLGPVKPTAWPERFFESIRIDDLAFVRPAPGVLPTVRSW